MFFGKALAAVVYKVSVMPLKMIQIVSLPCCLSLLVVCTDKVLVKGFTLNTFSDSVQICDLSTPTYSTLVQTEDCMSTLNGDPKKFSKPGFAKRIERND